jgi:hypothetical protein
MVCVSLPSIAYIATQVYCLNFVSHLVTFPDLQVRFSLSSSPVFSQTDLATDLERFYNSILDLFDDPDEKAEVNNLIVWWNQSVNNPAVFELLVLTLT